MESILRFLLSRDGCCLVRWLSIGPVALFTLIVLVRLSSRVPFEVVGFPLFSFAAALVLTLLIPAIAPDMKRWFAVGMAILIAVMHILFIQDALADSTGFWASAGAVVTSGFGVICSLAGTLIAWWIGRPVLDGDVFGECMHERI